MIKKCKIPYTDLKPKTRQIITKKWQQLWEKSPHKLFQVQSILKERKLDLNKPEEKKPLLSDKALDILD